MTRRTHTAALGFAALCIAAVAASHAHAETSAQAQHDKQRAECLAGKSNQDKATCLKEADNAFADARRGQLDDKGADYRKDQMERCKALSGDEQRDCLARMKVSGTVSGSVAGGGILREKTTKEVVRPGSVVMVPPAASAPN